MGTWLAGLPLGATESGMSPYIYGMHDIPDESLLGDGDNCALGWITDLKYIGSDGSCGAGDLDYSTWAAKGYGIIMRLDSDGGTSVPSDPGERDGYAQSFKDCVSRSTGIRVWIVGNEPNIEWGGHSFSAEEYGDIYIKVLQAVNTLPNGSQHEILFAGMACWASWGNWGDWDDGFAKSIDYVRSKGVSIDGVAIHAYTREFSSGAITSDAWFPGRENKWHLHFRIYRDSLKILADRGIVNIPLYITECGNVCDPPCDPYPDQDLGYFVAMYDEIKAWNDAHANQIMRAATPYRWTDSKDGTDRDFCIGCSGPLVADMKNAIGKKQRWDPSGCNSNPNDSDKDGYSPPDDCCDLGNESIAGCSPSTASTIYPNASEVCGNATDENCTSGDAPCPPENGVSFWWNPAEPGPNQETTIEVYGRQGYTSVGLDIQGPDGKFSATGLGIDGSCNRQAYPVVCWWRFQTSFPKPGSYTLSFVADPNTTVVGSATLVVPGLSPEDALNQQERSTTDDAGIQPDEVEAETHGDCSCGARGYHSLDLPFLCLVALWVKSRRWAG